MWSDEATTRLEYENAGMPVFQQTPAWRALLENGLAERGGALLSITSGDPYAMAGINPTLRAERRKAAYRDCHAFYLGMETGRVAWSIVGAASPKWAKAVFPQLPQEEAVQALWQAIFKAARADGPAPVAAWREHQKSFRARANWLNEQQFSALHYKKQHRHGYHRGPAQKPCVVRRRKRAGGRPLAVLQYAYRGNLHLARQG